MDRPEPMRPDASVSSSSVSSSQELLERAREGDSGALNRLFARYLPRLNRWAHRRVPTWARDAADTADLVQETVFRTLRRLDSFEPQRDGALLGYLRRALQNRVHDQFRRASRRPPIDPLVDGLDERIASDDESPLDVVIGHGDRRRYEAALTRLRPIDRRAIVASIELGYSYEQLALVLDKPSAPAARLAVRRALIRLGDEMRGA
jgi:RNA polymerase sigma-70 factor (ECF subfamily)